MIVLSDYRGFRVDVVAVAAAANWNAHVRISRALVAPTAHVETVACRERSARLAEERGAAYAQRWIDRVAG
ncbi:MAG TPA: hypothetical protein VHZ49_09765 [Methylomirabilota bacterium]|jgi:hypothetical protein|nr:hypothetical protein [Methylomirabilota bacterium]